MRKKFVRELEDEHHGGHGGRTGRGLGQGGRIAGCVDVALCRRSCTFSRVAAAIAARDRLGAQDMCCESNGAFTAARSPARCSRTSVAAMSSRPSERRHVIGESDELINRKVIKALGDGLEPIFCVGELLASARPTSAGRGQPPGEGRAGRRVARPGLQGNLA